MGAGSEPEYVSAEWVAAHLGLSEDYVWKLGREGALPRFKFGRAVRFRRTDVEVFIERSAA
jgi:excisionase family DNA binding protein